MREPGFEPGSPDWQSDILTTELLTLECKKEKEFKKILIVYLFKFA